MYMYGMRRVYQMKSMTLLNKIQSIFCFFTDSIGMKN